jgi:hypothetical protein
MNLRGFTGEFIGMGNAPGGRLVINPRIFLGGKARSHTDDFLDW